MVTATRKTVATGQKMPQRIAPMLCTLVTAPPSDENYIHEVKWDGYRLVAFCYKKSVRLETRSHKDYTEKYPLIAEAIKALKHETVIDGEAVVFNESGMPDFNAIQNYNKHRTPISFCVFDILYLDGKNLMGEPLIKRKEILKALVKNNNVLRFSESFDNGPALYERMKEMNLEGIVSKKKDGLYIPGDRSYNWLKVPTRRRQEFVIGGWAESDRGRSFRSLLFGVYNSKGEFEWVGRSGGGYKEKKMPGILKKLRAIEVKSSPFINKVLDTKGAIIHYVKPILVAIFEFATFTESGRIRKPATFISFRGDKNPKDVVLEIPRSLPKTKVKPVKKAASPAGDIIPTVKSMLKSPETQQGKKKYLNKDSNWKYVDEEQAGAEWLDPGLSECNIKVHNIDRELWPGISKAHLIMYYSKMADYILPYLRDRPQSLTLKLTDHHATRRFIKDMENRQPECVQIFQDKRRTKEAGKRNEIDYLVCNNRPTLVYMVDLGCVDINPWAARYQQPKHPDQIWIDLDPTIPEKLPHDQKLVKETEGFQKAIIVAQAAKKVLNKYKVKAFPKTSGQTGLHIYIPCSGFDYKQVWKIASYLADEIYSLVAKSNPHISTRTRSVNQRGEMVYIDADQNLYSKTLAAPYCIRPYHEPLVSAPLDWKEVKPGLDRFAFNMNNIQSRLKKMGDLFAGILDQKIAASNSKKLAALLEI